MAMPPFLKKKINGEEEESSTEESSTEESSTEESSTSEETAPKKGKKGGAENPLMKWAAKRGE